MLLAFFLIITTTQPLISIFLHKIIIASHISMKLYNAWRSFIFIVLFNVIERGSFSNLKAQCAERRETGWFNHLATVLGLLNVCVTQTGWKSQKIHPHPKGTYPGSITWLQPTHFGWCCTLHKHVSNTNPNQSKHQIPTPTTYSHLVLPPKRAAPGQHVSRRCWMSSTLTATNLTKPGLTFTWTTAVDFFQTQPPAVPSTSGSCELYKTINPIPSLPCSNSYALSLLYNKVQHFILPSMCELTLPTPGIPFFHISLLIMSRLYRDSFCSPHPLDMFPFETLQLVILFRNVSLSSSCSRFLGIISFHFYLFRPALFRRKQ